MSLSSYPEKTYLERTSTSDVYTDDTEWGDYRVNELDIEYIRADVVAQMLKRAKNPFRVTGVPTSCRTR